MTDNVEQPFVWLPWIALYLMMGIVFADDEPEEYCLGKGKKSYVMTEEGEM